MSDKGKLYIHIGPPKTATTSLQYFFQELDHPEIKYLGIHQPRSEKKTTVGRALNSLIIEENSNIRSVVLSSITEILNSGKSVVISEESILVKSKNVSWMEKVNRLFNILDKLNPNILITCRKPSEVLPSYYQELFYTLNRKEITDIEDFAKSDYCTIYKYGTLVSYLKKIGFKNVIILDYYKLINNMYWISDLIEINTDMRIDIHSENISPKSKKDRYAKKPSLKRIVYKKISVIKDVTFLNLIFRNLYLRNIFRKIPDISLQKGKKIEGSISQRTLGKFEIEYDRILSKIC